MVSCTKNALVDYKYIYFGSKEKYATNFYPGYDSWLKNRIPKENVGPPNEPRNKNDRSNAYT